MPYLNVTEVESALTALSAAHPGLCELITLPNLTHEGRTSHGIRLGLGALDNRPAMLFIGGQHAREWGSCEICINVATDLIDAYDANSGLSYGGKSFSPAQVKSVIENSQIFIFACVNPDGRNHSQTVSPLWRKNRNPVNPVDVNRNYDFLWDFKTAFSPSSPVSVSDIPSSDLYHGTAPMSEPENRNVMWLLDTYPQIRWMIDIHSYSRLLYHNWGDDENQITDPAMNFRNAAHDGRRGVGGDAVYREYIRPGDQASESCLVASMRDALQAVRGQTYSVGQSFALYPTSGTATDYPYSRHWVDATKTKTLGFLIEWGTEFQPPWTEMENIILDVSSALVAFASAAPCTCSTIDVQLLTPTVSFNSVPENEQTFRAAVFRVASCRDVLFEITAGPTRLTGPAAMTFGTPLGTIATAPGMASGTSDARVWIAFRGTSAGDHGTGTVTIRCQETGEEWVIPITADTIARPAAAALLVFDQSNSMNFDSGIGPGIQRADVLRFSAPPFIEVVEDINAVGIIAFDQDAYDRMAVTPMDLPGRLAASGHISSYSPNPNGWTSIGEGVARARDLLAPVAGYAIKAIVVLTDGAENHNGYTRRYITDVAGAIDNRVYAIGLGTAENLQPTALEALCNGHQGYLLITGPLDTSATFRLAKYYQQILAGVTNQDIIVDPEGAVLPGQVHRIPFDLNEADITADIIVLTPAPGAFQFYLETPSGDIIDPSAMGGNPAIGFKVGRNVTFYRLTLPVPLASASSHAGRWYAILKIDEKHFRRYIAGLEKDQQLSASLIAHGVPYSLTARAWSDINMRASVSQNTHEPLATMIVRAVLAEYDVPVEHRASVHVELVRPDATQAHLILQEVEPGVFEASTIAAISGVYRFRVLASGVTFHNLPFTREQLVTASVWPGGDHPPPSGGDDHHSDRERWCRLLRCLLHAGGVRERLKREGVDVDEIQKCLKVYCQEPRHLTGEAGSVRDAARELRTAFTDPKLRNAVLDLLRETENE
jgi:murein tripeptide amidase MpaA